MLTSKLTWHGPKVGALIAARAADGLRDAAEFVLEAANRTVPLDKGPLMDSGETDVDPHELVAAVSYDTPYAVRMHEHPEYNFQRGRRGKWLELTLKEQAKNVAAILAGKIKF